MSEHTEDTVLTGEALKEFWAKEDAITAQEDAELAEMDAKYKKEMAEHDARWNTLLASMPKKSKFKIMLEKVLSGVVVLIGLWALVGLLSGDKEKK